MEKNWIAESWDGFRPGRWNRTSVNVRDFIQNNYTPYEGDDSFLTGPTEATRKLWDQVMELSKKEREAGGVLDMDTKIVSGITSHGPGYLNKDLEQIVGFQTDKPFKRSLQPFGGIRMAQNACHENGYEVDPEVVELPKMDASKFVLSQSYYDGQTILLGYNLEEILPEPVVGYQVDEDLLREIKGTSQSFEGIDRKTYEEIFGPLPEYVQEHSMKRDALAMEGELRQILSPEAYEKMWQLLVQNGSVCVVTQSLYLGDHALVNGVDTVTTLDYNTGMIGMTDIQTEAGTCLYLNPLPEAGQNQSSVTVELKVKSGFQYWYLELEGHGYKSYAPNQEQSVSFTLDNVQETMPSAKED